MTGIKADTGFKQKRETQLNRVIRVLEPFWDFNTDLETVAKAVIEAVPDPYIKKKRGAPKTPDDACMLCAKRSEFVHLVKFLEGHADSVGAAGPLALACALREQGVV